MRHVRWVNRHMVFLSIALREDSPHNTNFRRWQEASHGFNCALFQAPCALFLLFSWSLPIKSYSCSRRRRDKVTVVEGVMSMMMILLFLLWHICSKRVRFCCHWSPNKMYSMRSGKGGGIGNKWSCSNNNTSRG